MFSVTSMVPSGITSVSEWKFSMRSSRVLKAEIAGKAKAEITKIRRNDRMEMQRTRIIRYAAPMSCGGSVEGHLGSFALSRRGDFEELARLESQHVGKDIGRELLDLGVQVADHCVVVAARVLDGIFDLGQRVLQRRKALNGAELWICFR